MQKHSTFGRKTDPDHMGSMARRLWARVQKDGDNGCWLWTGAVNNKGYGRIGYGGYETKLTHRAAYTLTYGAIPEDLVIDHKCGVPLCCNPQHLEAVTQYENVRRAKRDKITHCKRGHEFTPENTAIHSTTGMRICRACKTMHATAARAKIRRENPPFRHFKTHCKNGHPRVEGERACQMCNREGARRHYYEVVVPNRVPPVPRPKKTHCKNGHILDVVREKQQACSICRRAAVLRCRAKKKQEMTQS